MSVPKLRFKADDGSEFPEWKENVLREYLSFKNGLNVEKNKFGRGVKMISVLDILNNDYIVYDVIQSEVDIDENVLTEFAVDFGDVLFQRSSETREDAGKANAYLDKDHTATFGGFVIRGKKVGEYDPRFINIDFKSAFIRRQIVRVAQGDQHVNISQEMLSDIKIFMPTMNEQNKISDLFSRLDCIIKQIQSEIVAWEKQKRGVMQLLFSQKIRFKADDGSEFPEWEEEKLEKILNEYTEMSEKDGIYNHASLTKEGVVIKTERFNRDFLVKDDSKKYRVTHLNDICYNPANLKFGVICRNKLGDVIFSPIYITFKVNMSYDSIFIEYLVTRPDFINYALRYEEGTVYERMAVKPEDLLSIVVKVPCLAEQQKIAACLSAFDDVIDKTRKELNAYQELKKGLLQQMFV